MGSLIELPTVEDNEHDALVIEECALCGEPAYWYPILIFPRQRGDRDPLSSTLIVPHCSGHMSDEEEERVIEGLLDWMGWENIEKAHGEKGRLMPVRHLTRVTWIAMYLVDESKAIGVSR